MKNLFILIALLFSLHSMAQISESTSQTTMSPFATATELMNSATATMASPFVSTSGTLASSVAARGVAGKEQMRDELVALNDDMVAGRVKTIEQVRQSALKELFEEISADDSQMSEINSVVTSGSRLHRIATSVTIVLLVD